MLSTGSSVNGSMRARARIGQSAACPDAWMPFQPAIEEPSNAWPSSNLSLVEVLGGHRNVLLLAARVGEAQVDELGLFVLGHLQDIVGSHISHLLLS
jgi:hypothetical protein